MCVCDKVVFERDGLTCSVDVTKCHACHAKRRSMSPSATPATQNAHARSSSSRRLCVLHLSHESPSATRKPATAQRRPRAQQLLQEALCTAPATRKPAAGQRRPHARKLCVYCACDSQPLLQEVLRLPHESQPRASGGHTHKQLLQKALCTAFAMRQPAAGQRRPHASSRRLCIPRPPHESQPQPTGGDRQLRASGGHTRACHTTASRGPAAATRAAAPAEGSVHCACHTKASRGPAAATRAAAFASGGHACSSSCRRLCVLRLPHESQLCDDELCCHKWCDELCSAAVCAVQRCDDELCCHKWCDESCAVQLCDDELCCDEWAVTVQLCDDVL